MITTASKVTSEVLARRRRRPRPPSPRVVEPREQGLEYHVEHHVGPDAGDRLFVLTNADGAENFKLHGRAGRRHRARASWTTVLPHRADVRLDDVDAFAGHLVVSERADGLEQLRVLGLDDDGAVADDHVIDDARRRSTRRGSAATPSSTPTTLRYGTRRSCRPTSAYDYDLDTRDRDAREAPAGAGGYDPDALREPARLWATARRRHAGADLARAPHATSRATARSPLLLYGYGSYEVSIDPTFSSAARQPARPRASCSRSRTSAAAASSAAAGTTTASCCTSRNTFTDFIACAEHLVAEGYTAPDRLAARGGSAGGLLMGAVANLRPDLFRAVVAEVPFVDCLTTMLDETLPLTVTEWEEWGNPVARPGDLRVHEVVLALRQRRRPRTTPRCS